MSSIQPRALQPSAQQLAVAAPDTSIPLTQRMALLAPAAPTTPAAPTAALSPEEKAVSDWLAELVKNKPNTTGMELGMALDAQLTKAGLKLPEHQKRAIVDDAINTLTQQGIALDPQKSIWVLRKMYLNEKFDPVSQDLLAYSEKYPNAKVGELSHALDILLTQAGIHGTSASDKGKIANEIWSLLPDPNPNITQNKEVLNLMSKYMAEVSVYDDFKKNLMAPDEDSPLGQLQAEQKHDLNTW